MPARRKETVPINRKWLYGIKSGDKILRMIGGIVPMLLTVSYVTERIIAAGPWQFSRMWGLEVDSVMGSDGTPKTTVLSYIRKPTEEEEIGGKVLAVESATKQPSVPERPF